MILAGLEGESAPYFSFSCYGPVKAIIAASSEPVSTQFHNRSLLELGIIQTILMLGSQAEYCT